MAKEGKKKSIFKRWWFWGIIVVIVIVVAVNTGGDGESDPASTTASSDKGAKQTDKADKGDKAKKEKKTKVVGVGDPAKIADVAFTVNKVEEKKEIKSDDEFTDPAKASGKFIVLDVTIDNGKKKSIDIDSSYFKLKTKDGATYDPSTDGDVLMALPEKEQFFLEQINPGIKKTGTIVFDVPEDLDLTKAVLHCQTGFWGTETVDINLK